jgi:hypothetical protein
MRWSIMGTKFSSVTDVSCLLEVVFFMVNEKISLQFEMSAVPCYVGFSAIVLSLAHVYWVRVCA